MINNHQNRRQFLQTLALGAGALSVPVWSDDKTGLVHDLPKSMRSAGDDFSNYGKPSKYEKKVIRWVSANRTTPGNGVSWTPLHELSGTITPNGLHFERHHNGVAQIDPVKHRLVIDGLVERPLSFDVKSLLRYPMVSRICFIECGGNSNSSWLNTPNQSRAGYVHGLVSNAEWSGIPLSLLLQEAGIAPSAKWAIAQASDGSGLNVSIPVKKLLDDTILAFYQNGERLRPENGYPMRLVLPGWEAILSVKWLRQLKLVERPTMSHSETALYTELQTDGNARQFTFVMDAKSLITSPSVGMRLPDKPGIYQISGIAWSGRGKVVRVEVSTDNGKHWQDAELQTPILDKAFTRFNWAWRWHGETAILQSRVTDESGYVQPTRRTLINNRGKHGFFHYNAIVSWAVNTSGYISHVYPD